MQGPPRRKEGSESKRMRVSALGRRRGWGGSAVSRRQLRCGLVLVAAALAPLALGDAASPRLRVTDGAFEKALQLRPSQMGVTREGTLWGWNRGTGDVTMISVAGASRKGPRISGAVSVDAEEMFGFAALADAGARLRVLGFDGKERRSIALPDDCFGLCWISGSRVAVTPRHLPRQVLLVNVEDGKVAREYGVVPAKERRTRGLEVLRSVLVRFDPARNVIVALDAFEGTVSFIPVDGGATVSTALPNPQRAVMTEWLARLEATELAKGSLGRSGVVSFPSLSLDPDGNAWVGVDCEAESRTLVLGRVDPTGRVQERRLAGNRCCTVRGVIWGDRFIRHNDPVPGQVECHEVRTP